MAGWHEVTTGALTDNTVDMVTARALPTCLQLQNQQQPFAMVGLALGTSARLVKDRYCPARTLSA
jgi:hypothetical protein